MSQQYKFDQVSNGLFSLGIDTKIKYESRKAVIENECPENADIRQHLNQQLIKGICADVAKKLNALAQEFEKLSQEANRVSIETNTNEC